jgi:hypothetical protein
VSVYVLVAIIKKVTGLGNYIPIYKLSSPRVSKSI